MENDDPYSNMSQTTDSEGKSALSYLKSMGDSDSSVEDLESEFEEFSLEHMKTDEELATEPLWDPKMGPIFALFKQE